MTVEADIFSALMARVASLPGDTPVAWPNKQYPPEGQSRAPTYLVVSVVPNRPLRPHISSDDEHIHRGILNISVLSPLNGGAGGRPDLPGQVAAHFAADTRMRSGDTTIRVVEHPQVAQSYRDEDRWRTPVLVWYESIDAPV